MACRPSGLPDAADLEATSRSVLHFAMRPKFSRIGQSMGNLTPTATPAATRAAAACLLALLIPCPTAAQTAAPPSTGPAQGPMTVERVKSGFLVAPDFKVTERDRRVSELAGAY